MYHASFSLQSFNLNIAANEITGIDAELNDSFNTSLNIEIHSPVDNTVEPPV